MTPPSPTTLGPLLVVSVLGAGLAGFGYRLVSSFLRWTGWIGGGALGGIIGWQVLPQLIPTLGADQRLLWTAGLVVGGALLGRLFLPVATQFAAMVAGFLSTAGAVGIFFLGDPILARFTEATFETAPVETTGSLATDLGQIFATQGVEVLVIMFAAGVGGAIVATRYHTELIATGITLGGALLLGTALPLWQQVLTGSATLGAGVGSVSVPWAAGALVGGVVVQFLDQRRDAADGEWSLSES